MCSLTNTIIASVLFFVLTPGVLLTLPRKSSKYIVAMVHAIVFGVVLFLINYLMYSYEGFQDNLVTRTNPVTRTKPADFAAAAKAAVAKASSPPAKASSAKAAAAKAVTPKPV